MPEANNNPRCPYCGNSTHEFKPGRYRCNGRKCKKYLPVTQPESRGPKVKLETDTLTKAERNRLYQQRWRDKQNKEEKEG